MPSVARGAGGQSGAFVRRRGQQQTRCWAGREVAVGCNRGTAGRGLSCLGAELGWTHPRANSEG